MTTYSGLPNTPYYSEKVLNEYNYTQIENILLKLPDNNNQLIKPKSVRDAVYSLWENISFKNTGIGATARYIGVGDDTKLKFYFGKKQINGVNVMSTNLLNVDTDYYFYNTKGDTYSNTKIVFLAGTNTNIFTYSPYLEVKQIGTSSVSMEFINKGGDIIIGDGTQNVKIYGASGSIGMLNSTGAFGTIQVKGIGNSLNSIGLGAIGSALVVGTNGYLTFSTITGDTTSSYTINQILRHGNKTLTNLIFEPTAKLIFNSGTPSGIYYNNTTLYEDNNKDFNIVNGIGTISISAKTLKITIGTPSKFKFLMSSDANGSATWENISTYVDYNNIFNKPTLNYLPISGGRINGTLTVNGEFSVPNNNLVLSSEEYGIEYASHTFDTSTILKFNGNNLFVGAKLNYTDLEGLPDLSDVVVTSELELALTSYATINALDNKLNKNSKPDNIVVANLDDITTSGDYYIDNIASILNTPSVISGGSFGIYITVKVGLNSILQILYYETNRVFTRVYITGSWTSWA